MNERIKELSKQAEQYADDNFKGEPVWSEVYDQKFAELIVRECAMLVEGFILEQEVALDDYQEYEASAVLKEHFGIQE
jgi:hypothetical protein